MTARLLTAALIGAILPGCVINGDKWPRPRDLTPSWLVDRPRILAIRAEPPEVRPGETATFEALLPTPDDAELLKVWLACPLTDGALGCPLDLEGLDVEALDPAELADLGFIGIEPGLPPVYTAPEDLLDGLEDEAARREGVQVLVQLSGLPPEVVEAQAEIDFGEVEAGFKRLVVSEATTPNANPEIDGFTVDRNRVRLDEIVHVAPNQAYDLGANVADATIEAYEYLNSDGVVEERVEEPFVAWYATGGEITEPYTLWPYTEATWISPEAGTSGTWYAVVRDRRGGMAWRVQRWVVDSR